MTLKKWTALLLAALLALSLTACQDEKRISGSLVEVQTAEDGSLSALILEQNGKRTGILLAEKTSLWPRGEGSWTGEEALEAFRKDLQPGNEIGAWCYPRKEKLETAEGETIPAYWGQSISIEGILERNALTLRDGTVVDVLDNGGFGNSRTYRLSDGTELLRVEDPLGPENVQVMNLEGFEALSEPAQAKVRAYYEEQGSLYDEAEELERAYAAYRELGEEFQAGFIRQETMPTASASRVAYFTTELTLPRDYGTREHGTVCTHAAFDRETGEKLAIQDLFAIPEEEARRRFPELLGGWIDDPAAQADMAAALELEWIKISRDGLYIIFPAGSLTGEELECHVSVDWRDIPEGFFQPWAVPTTWREEGSP